MMWNRSARASFLAWALSTATNVASAAHSGIRDEIQWDVSNVTLPKPMSDIMATYMQGDLGDENGLIVLTGGCDDPLGNQRDPNIALDLFFCTSVTNSTYKYNPFDKSFTEMAQAPNARYRHAAAVAKGKLFLFGGRDADDNLVTAIDMFDPAANAWYTVGQLPDDIVTSDLSAWAWQDYIYVSGGFQADYIAVSSTYRLNMANVETNTQNGFDLVMNYEAVASADVARGDFHAIEMNGYAYTAGGITHANNWCTSLRDTERYHMATDTWETLSDLAVGRADMALAAYHGKIIAVGGEVKPPDCEKLIDPAYGSLPQDDVEVLIPSDGRNGEAFHWMSYKNYPLERFRFAAATVPALDVIYAFGGQSPFNETCQCYAASDKVAIAREVYEVDDGGKVTEVSSIASSESGGSGVSGGAAAGIAIACSVVSLALGVFLGKKIFTGKEESFSSGVSNSAPTSAMPLDESPDSENTSDAEVLDSSKQQYV